MIKVAISGYFDPIHVGHIEYIKTAKKLGDWLVVIVNNNHQCNLKKGKYFMDENDRVLIVKNIKAVAATGVNRISIGSITHSAPAIDLKFEM